MSEHGCVPPASAQSDLSNKVRTRMVQVVAQFVFMAAVLIVTSGRVDWTWLWVYVGVSVILLAINTLVLPRELIAERGRIGGDVKPWDRTITTLSLLPSLGLPVVAGLDERFGWSPNLATEVHLIGLAALVFGQGLFTWAMASNPFFSTQVRLQVERGHTVATGGPYRLVRHPGYVGYITMMIATALLFGSLWALVPAAVMLILLLVRTALEDKTLRDELEGYEEYARRVRYRLVPGIW